MTSAFDPGDSRTVRRWAGGGRGRRPLAAPQWPGGGKSPGNGGSSGCTSGATTPLSRRWAAEGRLADAGPPGLAAVDNANPATANFGDCDPLAGRYHEQPCSALRWSGAQMGVGCDACIAAPA